MRRWLPLLLGWHFVSSCAPKGEGDARPTVFVSILPQAYFVKRVAASDAAVSVMVGPGESPATYEPTPRQMADLAGAWAYFRIGVPFERAWMPRITAANQTLRVFDTSAGIARLGDDPHVWTDPRRVKTMAANLGGAFSAMRPERAATYSGNVEAFSRDLDALDADIRETLRPVARRRFMAFHPSWAYFAEAYGLEQIAVETEGKEPGARTLAAYIELGRKEQVKVVFVQPQFSRRTAETVARAIGARVVAIDPLAADYMDNMRAVARSFAAALEAP